MAEPLSLPHRGPALAARQVVFEQPDWPVSINALRGKHWKVWARLLDPWQAAASNAWFLAGLGSQPPAYVRCEFSVPDRRKRDPHNYTGTVVKAVMDGLVRADAWPDDNPAWVLTDEPRLLVGGHTCRVTITPWVTP